MKRNISGFTLIELMIVIAIIGILATVVFHAISGGGGAKGQMVEYVQEIYGKSDVNISCKKWDTDGDGNIRCTAAWDENGERKVVSAECGYVFGGCSEMVKARRFW